MVAVTILLFGLLGFTHSILRAVATNESTRESAIAGEAARQMLETLQAAEFDEVFRLYNQVAGDDPDGPGTAPGSGFAVPGLEPVDGDPDGLVGEILFPASDAVPGMLREDLVSAPLGMPRDLDGDGNVDGFDHSTDYRILPVVVRLTWRGTNGVTRAQFRTLLGDYL
jgi:hypothetical protein